MYFLFFFAAPVHFSLRSQLSFDQAKMILRYFFCNMTPLLQIFHVKLCTLQRKINTTVSVLTSFNIELHLLFF